MIYRGQPFLGRCVKEKALWLQRLQMQRLSKAFHSLGKEAINSKGHFLIWLRPYVAEVCPRLRKWKQKWFNSRFKYTKMNVRKWEDVVRLNLWARTVRCVPNSESSFKPCRKSPATHKRKGNCETRWKRANTFRGFLIVPRQSLQTLICFLCF